MRFVIRSVSVRGVPWVVLLVALLATAFVCGQVWRRQKESRQARFEAEVAVLSNAMLERLDAYARVLLGGSGLFAASESVGAPEFRAYVQRLDLVRHYPGILALGYTERVEHGRRDEFLRDPQLVPAGSGQTFRIWPAGNRPDYLVVRMVEPLDANRAALGYDMGSETERRAAAMSARDKGEPVLTAKLELVQAPGQAGAIMLLPVYRGGSTPVTVAQRRAQLQGWIYAAFRISDMMDGVSQITRSELDYEIFDGDEPAADRLLGHRTGGAGTAAEAGFGRTSRLAPYGREWTLRFRSAGKMPASAAVAVGWIASGGICMSLLVCGIVYSMATTGRRAVELAAGMTVAQRRHENALRAGEERLAMVIEGSNDGVWDWNVTTNEVYFSPRWKSMLGYEELEIENTFSAWEALLHPDERERALGVVHAYFEGKLPCYQLEHRLRHKDGSYRWILARGVASRDREGRPVRMAGSHVDLTELKQAEHELRQANTELLRSKTQLQETLSKLQVSHEELGKTQLELIQAAKLESVGTLAAGVAHEVKNPLQIILMGIDFLRQRFADADEATCLTLLDMRDAVGRADAISRELLQFSAATDFSPTIVDLETVLERSLWLTRSDLAKSHANVVRDLAGELPPVAIDPPKIQQVIINLLHNAIQAMGNHGTLTVATASGRLQQFLESQPGAHSALNPDAEVVVLRLHDTGPGIPDKQLAKVFDPFFTTKAVGSGTGLGLSVVKKIIDLHGALIAIRNAPQGGFEVTLAFAAARPGAAWSPGKT